MAIGIVARGSSSGLAATETERHQAHIRALLKERDNCERRGLHARVKEINKELGEVAQDAEPPAQRAQKRIVTATTAR